MSRLLLAAGACLLLWFADLRAALDAEVNKPYQFRVALKVASHRLLTPYFKDRLQLDLRDILQNALGAMAEVEIVDLANKDLVEHDPVLKRVAEKGLQDGLDGPQPVTGVKTHFIFVDFDNGRYQIEARQHDGLTGLSSPVLRRVWTDDRLLVARSAALLISQDFGLVGTVEHVDKGKVKLLLKGAGLTASLPSWVRKDDVFAVVAILSKGGNLLQGERLPWALLRVLEDPRGPECVCQIFNRLSYDNGEPLPRSRDILGFRCLKLGTRDGQLRLRFVAADRSTPLAGLQIKVSSTGFEGNTQEEAATTSDGIVQFRNTYHHAAFVRVLNSSGQMVAKLPIEIIPERGTVLCPVSINPEDEQRGQLEQRKTRWVQRLNDSLEEYNTLTRDLNATSAQGAKVLLPRAKAGIESLRAAIDLGDRVHTDLKRVAGSSNPPLALPEGEDRLKELRARLELLEKYVKNLEKIEKDDLDPKRKVLLTQAEEAARLEEQAEYDQAIALYKKLLQEGAADPNVKKRLDQLEHDWAVKNEDHRRARAFIYETWAKLQDPETMKDKRGELRGAFNTCRDVGDFLTLQKLLRTCTEQRVTLQKLGDSLQPNDEDDKVKLRTVVEVLDFLKELSDRTADYLKQAKTGSR